MKFLTKLIDNQAATNWPAIMREAAKYQRAIVDVHEYDDKAEISEQQCKYLHCKAGPIMELVRDGWSFREAKEYIKVEYGRKWFVVELTDDNCHKVDGVFRWECRFFGCRKLIHPMDATRGTVENDRCCPHCGSTLSPIALKSITNVSVKNINNWLDEMFAHFPKKKDGITPRILPPDANWRRNEKKK